MLLWIGDISHLPDPASVETAKWNWECAAMSGEKQKTVLTFPLWWRKIMGEKQRQGLSQHMLQ